MIISKTGPRFRWGEPETTLLILRAALGLIFIIGGVKIAFPSDAAALAASYVDPARGWISPVFADWITGTLGMEIAEWLRMQGFVEIVLGLLMAFGAFTPIVGVAMGLMLWSFAVANPVVGEVRLSRDIALMGLCLATALVGAGPKSIDGSLRGAASRLMERHDAFTLMLRLSLAYTLVASTLFTHGVFANHLNSTIPVAAVFAGGLALAIGVFPRWVMTLVFVWMLYLLAANLVTSGLFSGLDSVKRELGFLSASLAYVVLGGDRWAWPREDRVKVTE